ncbi:MAG: apolipoprotein N-acyltransferase [Nitrospirota bacterium]
MKLKISEIFKNYSPAFISGLLVVLCFPKFDLFYLAWIALIPFLLSVYNKSPKEAFKRGLFFGMPYFLGTLYWIYHSINHYGGLSFIVSIVIVILLCLYLSLYTGLFAILFSIAIKNTRLPALLIAPAFWVVLEFIRSYLFTGFPWASIGYTQYKFLPVIQIADITGINGVSFLIVAVNSAIVDLFLIKKRIWNMPLYPLSYTIIGFSILFLLVASTLVYGYWRLGEEKHEKEIKASIIQGNIEQDKKWDPVYQRMVIDTYKGLSSKASVSSPSLIIWPETALPFFFGSDSKHTEDLVAFQKQLNTYLLFGSILVKGKKDDSYLLSNSVVLLDKSGKISYVYDKLHLVPFGEYIPLKKLLFFINKLVGGVGDYCHGEHYLSAETSFGSFSTLVCYEVIFPGQVRKFFLDKGDFIVNITNDAWFGKTAGPFQHFSMAVFRAVENRKPLIRAANTGISGFIDSKGRIISKTGLFQEAILTDAVLTNSTKSFYTKFGDLFSYLCIIFSVILLTNIFSKSKPF